MTPYDDPSLSEFTGYLTAKEPGRRERADAWATAIGLQQVDGLKPSPHLYEVAKRHIEGEISASKARNLVDEYYEPLERFFQNLLLGTSHELKSRYLLVGLTNAQRKRLKGLSEKGCQKKVVRKGCQKTSGKLTELLRAQPHLTQVGMAAALGISRQAVQKHIARLKSAGRLRRIGPDKGGHWEIAK